jgi:hypothetical protein
MWREIGGKRMNEIFPISKKVIIYSITKEVINECPSHYGLPHLMEELTQWIDENSSKYLISDY